MVIHTHDVWLRPEKYFAYIITFLTKKKGKHRNLLNFRVIFDTTEVKRPMVNCTPEHLL